MIAVGRQCAPARSRRHAIAVVEMAILLPMILLLLLGMMEYGWCFLKQEQILNTARQAARLGALVNSSNGQVTTQITSMMGARGYNFPANSYTYAITDTSGNAIDVSNAAKGQAIKVTITISDYSTIAINDSHASLAPISLPMPSSIKGTVTMIKEGQ